MIDLQASAWIAAARSQCNCPPRLAPHKRARCVVCHSSPGEAAMKDTIKNFVHYPKLSKAAINHLQSNSDPGRTLGRTEPRPGQPAGGCPPGRGAGLQRRSRVGLGCGSVPLLLQLQFGVSPSQRVGEGDVHLDELEPSPGASAAIERSSHGRVVLIVVGLISNGHGDLPASAPLTPLRRGWQPYQCGSPVDPHEGSSSGPRRWDAMAVDAGLPLL
jgi:hypothetical protein